MGGGINALLDPYTFQAGRDFNGESSYDAIFFFLQATGMTLDLIDMLKTWIMQYHIPVVLQIISCLVIPLLIRVKDWHELLEMWILVILCFISFSIFHSPQFLIWYAVLACLLPSSRFLIAVIIFAWLNYLYFPVAYDTWKISGIHIVFIAAIWTATMLRFYMITELLLTLIKKKSMNCSG